MLFELARLLSLDGVQRSIDVLSHHDIRDVCNGRYSKEELQALLADERGTARRHELLKAIWMLSQQLGDDSHVTAKKAIDRSATASQSSDIASHQGRVYRSHVNAHSVESLHHGF